MVEPLRAILVDPPHLFRVRDGVDDVPGPGRDQVDHRQAFLLHRLAHEHMGLEEDVLLAHAGDRRTMPALAA